MPNFSQINAHNGRTENYTYTENQARAPKVNAAEAALDLMRPLAQQAIFIQQFKIEILGRNQAKIDLGQDFDQEPRISFLKQAQELALALHNRPAIAPEQLERWRKDPAFGFRFDKGGAIAVNCNVEGSANLTRPELAPGLNNIDICDLAVTHAGYLVATGEDFFSGNLVRGRDGTLGFNRNGLFVFSLHNADRDERQPILVSSQAIPGKANCFA